MTVAVQRLGLRITAPDSHTDIDAGPLQGLWTEAQYLQLTDHARLLLEFTDGRLEVPPMPTDRHQAISQFLFLALSPFVGTRGGRVRHAPLRLRIRDGKFREPTRCSFVTRATRGAGTTTGAAPTWSWRSSVPTTPIGTRR